MLKALTFRTLTLALALAVLSGCQKNRQAELWDGHLLDPTELSDYTRTNKNFWYLKNARIGQWEERYRASGDHLVHWKRASEYLPEIQTIFQRYRLPNELCLLPIIESSFSEDARSARAVGMWQFVKPTAIEMGLVVNNKTDERLDWRKSTEAAARYLSQLSLEFNGDWALVLAAYNAGPGTVRRAMAEQGTNDYWKLEIREETSQYVPKFLAMIHLLRRAHPKV